MHTRSHRTARPATGRTITRKTGPAAGLILLAAPALAQDTQPAEIAPPAEETPPAEVTQARKAPAVSLTLSGSWADTTDLDAAGDLQVTRVRGALEVAFDLAERTTLTAGLGAERSWYDFSGATNLDPSGEPFGDVTDTELFLRYNAPLNDTTGWFALASIGIAAEDGADYSDSLVYTGALGFQTRVSDDFSWGLGVLVRSRLEDDALIIPIPQIRWALSDKWTLESRRAGLRLDYAHSDTLSYGLQGEYVSRSFRLDEDGPIPDGMATDRAVPLSFYADLKPAPNVAITGRIGAALAGEIEILDSTGADLADEEYDPALFLSVTARIAF